MSGLEAPVVATTEGGREALLSVRDLEVHFPVRGGLFSRGPAEVVRAVDGVSLDVAGGEVFGLVGESGSGKTTLGRAVLNLIPPTGGSVTFRGTELAGLSERKMRPLRRDLALISQDPNAALNPAMTVGQGVAHPLRIHGLATSRAEAREEVVAMLERVGLQPGASFLDVYPEDLSGGQKQRIVIARALITNPSFVVADEPVAALDMSVRAKVLELLRDLGDDLGLTYLMITHDLATARLLCDRVGILYLGELVEEGAGRLLFDEPKHPYTRALLDAVPVPDPARRHRRRELPQGEVPDALDPPRGCRFHPRCPEAFAPCGWEARDLVTWFEQRWASVDEDVFEAELAATGPLDAVESHGDEVRFASGDARELVALFTRLQAEGGERHRVLNGVLDVTSDDGGVLVHLTPSVLPVPQPVHGRTVACHLYGVPGVAGGPGAGGGPPD